MQQIDNSESDMENMSLYSKSVRKSDVILKILIYFSAVITIGFFILLIAYVIFNGVSYVSPEFLFSTAEDGGILSIIINTLYVEFFTLLFAIPIGVGAAIYLTQYVKQGKFVKLIRFSTETLAGIPSILFGLFGYTIFCVLFGLGSSIIAGYLTMIICVLPGIIRTTEEALLTVPNSYKNGSLALGAGKFRTIFQIVLPCAIPGILTSVILAVGRIMGESAAFLLTIGTGTKMPKEVFNHIFSSGRTLTLHLYYMSGNGSVPDAMKICFAIATILLVLIFVLNILAKLVAKRFIH